MISNPRSVFDVFATERQFTIPLFQRRYVWTLERQWQPLWEDIEAKAIEETRSGPHFLGAIVLNPQTPSLTVAVNSFDVIDGQQRLTTFQILLAALRDVALELLPQNPQISEYIGGYTRNRTPIFKKSAESERYKVWPTQADTAQFKDVMDSGSLGALEQKYPAVYKRRKLQPRPAMVEAYLYFYKTIASFAQTPQTTIEAQLQSLCEALQNRLLLVAIELDPSDDPQVIFETLNARGAPLQPSDLLRNFIFLRATRHQEDAFGLYKKYWAAFDVGAEKKDTPSNPFWQEEDRQGRLKRPRLDLFMQHFLALKTSNEINLSRLFQEYRQWILKKAPYSSVEEELKELTKYADIFQSLYKHNLDSRLGLFTQRLRALDTSTVYPLLFLILGDPSIPKEEIEGIVTDLESFLVRRMVCNLGTKNYNHLFLLLVKDAFKDGVTRKNLRAQLLAQVGSAGSWPDDNEFQKAWMHTPIYRILKPWRIEMVLLALERELYTSKQEKITIHEKLTIEHILPQSWEEHWPLPNGKLAKDVSDDDEASARREQLLQTFGNLTLFTGALNSALQNDPFLKKKVDIMKNTKLTLNVYFQDKQAWNEDEIEKRGRVLFELAKRVWPYPSPQAPAV